MAQAWAWKTEEVMVNSAGELVVRMAVLYATSPACNQHITVTVSPGDTAANVKQKVIDAAVEQAAEAGVTVTPAEVLVSGPL